MYLINFLRSISDIYLETPTDMSKNDDKCKLSFESLCRTKDGEEVKFNFVWAIKNFTAASPDIPGKCLYSSIFNIQAPYDIKSDWKIALYPKGCFVSEKSVLSVFVYNHIEGGMLAKTKFSILDEAKNKHYQKNGNYGDDWEEYNEDNEFGLCEFLSLDILHSKALTLLPNDCLTILCEVAILIPDKSAPVSVDGDSKMVQTGQENLLKELELAFSQKEFTDVQIQ